MDSSLSHWKYESLMRWNSVCQCGSSSQLGAVQQLVSLPFSQGEIRSILNITISGHNILLLKAVVTEFWSSINFMELITSMNSPGWHCALYCHLHLRTQWKKWKYAYNLQFCFKLCFIKRIDVQRTATIVTEYSIHRFLDKLLESHILISSV